MHAHAMSTAASSPQAMLPLRSGDRVALHVEELVPVAATVVDTTPLQATLLLGEGAMPARLLHRREAAIERFWEGRRFRGEGVLAMTMGRRGKIRDDTVVLHFGPQQRRATPRVGAVLPVTLVPTESPVGPARALTLDVSTRGALVRSPTPLKTGAPLQVHLQLPGEELPVPAAGAVVRRTDTGLLGVRLDRMRDSDRALVEQWLRAQAPRP